MPNVFSSNLFNLHFMKNGGTQYSIEKGFVRTFLHDKAQPMGNSPKRIRTWIRKSSSQGELQFGITDQMAIDHLKKTGMYRIIKLQEIEI